MKNEYNTEYMTKRRNGKGGKKHRKTGSSFIQKKSLYKFIKDVKDLEVYGKVVKPCGDRKFQVYCQKLDEPDKLFTLVCKMKGSLRPRISKDDFVLIKLSDYGLSEQGFIVEKITPEIMDTIIKMGQWDYPDDNIVEKHNNASLYPDMEYSTDEDLEESDKEDEASSHESSDEEDVDNINIDEI
jgi:translation initiation factor IF-1